MGVGKLGDTRVLCNWQPSVLSEAAVKTEFTVLIKRLVEELTGRPTGVRQPRLDIRKPQNNFVGGLHRDCNAKAQYIVCWSNVMPTLVRYAVIGDYARSCDVWGDWLEARAGDVILINNREVKHDAPASRKTMELAGRWFVRVRLTPTGRFKRY